MNIIKISSLLTTIVLFSGCSDTPRDVVNNMYDALKNGDFVKFTKNSIDPVSREYSVKALGSCSKDKINANEDFKIIDACLKEAYGDINVKSISMDFISTSKVYANVIITKNWIEEENILLVVKIDGKWKVAFKKKAK